MSVDPVRASVIRFVPRYFALSVRRRGLDLINRLGLAQLASAAGPRYLRIARNRLNARSLESISCQKLEFAEHRSAVQRHSFVRARIAFRDLFSLTNLSRGNKSAPLHNARARARSIPLRLARYRSGDPYRRAFVIAWKPAHLT